MEGCYFKQAKRPKELIPEGGSMGNLFRHLHILI